MTEKTKFNPLFQYLQHNEAFVWIGKPAKKRWRKRVINPDDIRLILNLSACACMLIPVIIYSLIVVISNPQYILLSFTCIGTTLLLMLLHHRIYRLQINQEWEHRYGSVYAISNLHLFLWRNQNPRSIPIDWVEHAIIEVHGKYETIRWYITPPYEDAYIQFDYVKNAEDIVNIVADVLGRPILIVKAK